MSVKEKTILKGGEYLLTSTDPEDVFTPEDYTEEQKMSDLQ